MVGGQLGKQIELMYHSGFVVTCVHTRILPAFLHIYCVLHVHTRRANGAQGLVVQHHVFECS